MHPELAVLVPTSKLEMEKAKGIVALGFPAVEPILPDLLKWIQDINWPVARILAPFLASVGAPLAPHIRRVLATTDDLWKYWVISAVVANSNELRAEIEPELLRLASSPTAGERAEEVDIVAKEVLRRRG